MKATTKEDIKSHLKKGVVRKYKRGGGGGNHKARPRLYLRKSQRLTLSRACG